MDERDERDRRLLRAGDHYDSDGETLRGMLRARTGLSPKLLRGEAGAFGEAAQFGPGEVGMDPAAEAAIGAGDDVLAPDHPGEVEDAVGDYLRVLHDVGGVADDRHEDQGAATGTAHER